jgi:hypothetical protein
MSPGVSTRKAGVLRLARKLRARISWRGFWEASMEAA